MINNFTNKVESMDNNNPPNNNKKESPNTMLKVITGFSLTLLGGIFFKKILFIHKFKVTTIQKPYYYEIKSISPNKKEYTLRLEGSEQKNEKIPQTNEYIKKKDDEIKKLTDSNKPAYIIDQYNTTIDKLKKGEFSNEKYSSAYIVDNKENGNTNIIFSPSNEERVNLYYYLYKNTDLFHKDCVFRYNYENEKENEQIIHIDKNICTKNLQEKSITEYTNKIDNMNYCIEICVIKNKDFISKDFNNIKGSNIQVKCSYGPDIGLFLFKNNENFKNHIIYQYLINQNLIKEELNKILK